MNAPTQLATLQNQSLAAPRESQNFAPGFGSLQSFELMQRAAKLLSSSTLVPVAYRANIEKLDRFGNVKESRPNPNALANSVVALNMAQRMGADPLMVMQNLYIVEGRPSWSSQWIIAAINGCGRFSPLRFDIEQLGEREVERTETFWENNERRTKTIKVKIKDKKCVAWALEKETGARIESPAVTIEMAVMEGWYTKNGSKWQTMDEVMLRYRTASFFGKLYAPELLMGLQTVEEAHDYIDITPAQDFPEPVDIEAMRPAAQTTLASAAPATEQANTTNTVDHAASDAQQTIEQSDGYMSPAEQAAIHAAEMAEAQQEQPAPKARRERTASTGSME